MCFVLSADCLTSDYLIYHNVYAKVNLDFSLLTKQKLLSKIKKLEKINSFTLIIVMIWVLLLVY